MSEQLRNEHFLKLARLMEEHTGIQLPPSKRLMVEGRLRRRVRALNFATLAEYGGALFDGGLITSEFPHLVDCVTTNKTDFFREPDHFDFLRDHAVPALIKARGGSPAELKIWSAACSMGAEAYTAAMVLAAMVEAGSRFRFSILGTDISHTILEQARRAIYPVAMADPIPDDFRRLYVMKAADPSRDEVRIVPELRRVAVFEHLNLTDESYPVDRDVDVIFCRNILIYFSKPMQQAVLTRLASHLRPGGFLVLGHSESFALDDKAAMHQISPTIFQRTRPRIAAGRAA
jgi:chemotaxis methyl-accepting protein methylase